MAFGRILKEVEIVKDQKEPLFKDLEDLGQPWS